MNTRSAVQDALVREVDKLIRRHNRAAGAASLDRKRYEKRSGKAGSIPTSIKPPHWEAHPHFDPFHVRSRVKSFAHALSRKIKSYSYAPNPFLLVPIPKPGGGSRDITICTVPDAAIGYWLGKRLIERNVYRFSSYTYAYRADRNAHHAIEHIKSAVRGRQRLFVLEYDFAKYFDSIRHDYLFKVLKEHFLVSEREYSLLESFVANQRARSIKHYIAGTYEKQEIGIPQGSNVSLFLANVACFELDKEIEQVGVTFARYADDTLIVCDTYEKADTCAKLLLGHGSRSGAQINFQKSPGISLLTPDSNAEVRPKPSVDYLSHSLSSSGVAISKKAVVRMKKRIAKIIYNNLLLQPKRKDVNPNRIGLGFVDWDLVTCVNELRRYIYGRISESSLTNALMGKERVNTTLCAMSFYPTVDATSEGAIKALDGWLVDTLSRAYQKRVDVLHSLGIVAKQISEADLIAGTWYTFATIQMETRLPSFFRAWLYVRKAASIYGLDKFPSPGYDYI